jgi:hypothetical protein
MAMRALLGMLCTLAGVAVAGDVPVAAKRLVVKDSARPRLVLTVKGPVPAPTPGGGDDPQVTGAVLEVYGALGEAAVVELPASGWTYDGSAFRFRNLLAPAGPSPVRSVLIRPGKRLKVVARTPGVSLDEPSQQSIGTTLAMGTLRYCSLSGGAVTRDEPGRFTARNAPAPVACPIALVTTTTSTSSSTVTTLPGATTTSTVSATSSTSVTSTSETSTTATTSSSTTSTLVAGCAPPAVAAGAVEFTIAPGTTDCGGPAFMPASPGPFRGRLENDVGTTIADLASGCLYVGGGLSNALPPARLPDGAVSLLSVSSAAGLSLTLAASDGNGAIDCTRGAGPLRHCADGSPGTDTFGLCTSDDDCGSTGTCLFDAHCFFGPPIALPSPTPALSSCVVNAIGSDACGTADLAGGGSSLSVALRARHYLTSDQASPCPRCVAGTCTAGARAGLACSGGVGSGLTSNDCPPTPLQYVGELLVNPLQLSTGSAVASADADGFFCPGQRTPGAFGLATARTMRVAGSPLLGGPTLFSTTLAGTFCVPSSGNPLVDNIEDLPGPGAVSVPGAVNVCLGLLCL